MQNVATPFLDVTALDASPAEEAPRALIGPNAVIQLHAALLAAVPEDIAHDIFRNAGGEDWLAEMPGDMVDEKRVARLFARVRTTLPAWQAQQILARAGTLTADYLLAHRIPAPARLAFRVLPRRAAAYLLTRAIRANAWTFCGSGEFSAEFGKPLMLRLKRNPLCDRQHALEPICAWTEAVFQRLFQTLVSPTTTVTEVTCEATGGDSCCFVVQW
jgi:divinyl protochlorophyllide a 8-vinyl-reductase